MFKKLLIAVFATAFFAAVTLPNFTVAQTTTTTEDTKKKKTTKKKAPTAKQLAARKRFADCAKSWGDHKKATGEKGQKAYRAYMGKCLKKKDA